jgi:DNA-binding GntR family transcriptional regulator
MRCWSTVDRPPYTIAGFRMSAPALSIPAPARMTLAQGVAVALREAIFQGSIQPDQRLSEAQIASTMKVSRAPVRDAVAELEQEGLLIRPAGRGVVVRLLGHRDVEEICSLRLALERLAVQRVVRSATPDQLRQLAATIDEVKNVSGPSELALADLRFHETLVRAAGHDRLLSSWLSIRSQIRLLMVQRNLVDAGTVQGTPRAHGSLLAALQAGDEKRALGLLERQLTDHYTWFLQTFPASAATDTAAEPT